MKKWQKALLVLLAIAVLSVGAVCMTYAAEGEINVSGVGVVQANPDTAELSLNIEVNEKTAQAAQQENNRLTEAVTKAMTDMNVKQSDIVTAYTSVYPSYRYDDVTGKRIVTGYYASTTLRVTTKDIDNAGKYIDAALQAGATGSDGVTFSIADQSIYYAQALQAAVKNAETSATAIAQAYGKSLGAVKKVTELSSTSYYVDSSNYSIESGGGVANADAAKTTISYGKMDVTASISVTYGF